jgi:sugar phosphate isomerase/epimerase
MKRRTFLQTTGVAGLLTVLGRPAWAVPADSRYAKTLGLQVYTVRNQLAKDIPGTLKAIADAGYYQVELMNVADADQYLPIVKDNGMVVTSAFIDWRAMATPDAADVVPIEKQIEQAKQHGIHYLVFGYVGKGHRETADQLKTLAERANKAGEKCREAGIQYCYHNHSFEFQPLPTGQTGFSVFVQEFDPQLVKFELDVFWAAIGGLDPVTSLKRLKGRVAQVHLKDLLPGVDTIYDEGKVPAEAFKEVGQGRINWTDVLQACEATGVEQCHVEQDQSPDPVASIAMSLKYVRGL